MHEVVCYKNSNGYCTVQQASFKECMLRDEDDDGEGEASDFQEPPSDEGEEQQEESRMQLSHQMLEDEGELEEDDQIVPNYLFPKPQRTRSGRSRQFLGSIGIMCNLSR